MERTMVVHPRGVVKVESMTDKDFEEMEIAVEQLEKQFAKCEKTFLIMAIAIVALLVKIVAT